MTVFGDGEQVRAFSYIGDVAPIIADAVTVPAAYNEVFNLGADQPYTVNELARAVAQAMGVSPQFDYLPARHETLSAYSNHEKVARVFGRRPGHTLALGLERMAAWAKHHGPRQSSVFDDIEVTKNFPAGWLTAK